MELPTPTLLILAAGMGSRYGGLKQFESMGPGGECLLDYAVFDALRAGFGRVVFVIGATLAPCIQEGIRKRYGAVMDVELVQQHLWDVPGNFRIPPERVKPWGTLHAVLAARDAVRTPFAVINADDFYGPAAYRQVADFFSKPDTHHDGRNHYCMVGYAVARTLSANGGVNRGICASRDGFLAGVEEHVGIVAGTGGRCSGFRLDGGRVDIPNDAVASMNFWGFTPAVFAHMQAHFVDFLAAKGNTPGAECYIPSVVDELVRTGQADCRILKTDDPWFGVTYAQDMQSSQEQLASWVDAGIYPRNLWPQSSSVGPVSNEPTGDVYHPARVSGKTAH